MFGMGMPEILLILAIALIVIGPKKLPDLAKSLGRAMNEFKHAANEFKDSMDLDNDIREVKKSFDDVETELKKKVVEVKPKKPPIEGSGTPATEEAVSAKPVETAPENEKKAESPQRPISGKKDLDSPPPPSPGGEDMEDEFYAATDIPAELMETEEEKDSAATRKTAAGTDGSEKTDGETKT